MLLSLTTAGQAQLSAPGDGAEGEAVAASAEPVAAEPAPAQPASTELQTIAVEGAAKEEEPVEQGDAAVFSGIEEIVVTAQKREEKLQDVPISISAFTGDQLDKSGVQTLDDLAFKTPGLVFDTQLNYAIIFLRGVGTDAFIPSADMSVAPYVDGVYFPNSFGLARALGEVERVEVLKGPQGTLFGRNSTGGAINVVTKAPPDVFSMSADTSYGSFNETNNRLSIGGPVSDTLSVSASVLYNYKEEYYNSVEPSFGGEFEPSIDRGARVKALWRPSELLDVTLTGFHFESVGLGTVLMPCLEPSAAGALLGVTCPEPYDSNVNSRMGNRTNFQLVSLIAGWHPGAFDVKSISAYQQSETGAYTDFDGSSANIATFTAPYDESPLTSYTFSQELQVLSNDDSWGADFMRWIGGLYYFNSNVGYDAIHVGVLGLDTGLGGLATGQLAGTSLLNVFAPLLPGEEFLAADIKVTGELFTDAYAGFAQVTFMPWDPIEITLGGRYQYEERTVSNSNLKTSITVLTREIAPTLVPYADQSRKEDRFSPKVSLAYKPAKDVMFYASWQRAYKSGSFNILNITQPPTTIRPETVTTTEIGAKTRLFGGYVQLNGAVFNNEIKDLQSQFLSLLSGGITQFQNAPKAYTRGAEADLQWLVTDGLTFSLAATYLKSEYESFPNANGYNELGLFTGGVDNTGNDIVRNPEWTVASGLNYSADVGNDGRVEAGVDYYYNGGYFFDAQNTIEQNPYSLVNARVAYLYKPWNVTVALTGANLLEEKYLIFAYQQDFASAGKFAPPRTYAIRLHWDF